VGGTEKGVLDRALGGVQDSGDGPQFQAVIVLQLKNYALTRRESSQGANDAFAQFAADRASLGAGACPVIGHVVQHFFFLALGRNGCGQIAAARIFLAQVIKAKISHNAVDPRVERTFEAETSQVDVGAEECLNASWYMSWPSSCEPVR